MNVTARKVTKEARADLESVLPRLGYDAGLTTTIRHVEATARAARRDGLLAHELDLQARESAAADPDAVYSSLTPTGKLAEDYVNLTREVQQRILDLTRRTVGAQAATQGPAQ